MKCSRSMDVFKKKKLAVRYAEGLRTLVTTEESLGKVNDTYQKLNQILREVPEVIKLLKNPSISFDIKKEIINEVLDLINAPEFFRDYVLLLIKNKRVEVINEITETFSESIDKWLNRIEVEITTAISIPPEAEKKLVLALERFTEKKVRITKKIDPSILGGLIVRFYGFTFDFSYKTQINKIKEEILARGYIQDVFRY